MRYTAVLLTVLAGITQTSWAMSVALRSSVPSPAPLGKIVTWTASVSDALEGTTWYRFRARSMDQDFKVIKDFGPVNTLDWTAISSEGFYEIEVTARNLKSGDWSTAAHFFEMQPLAGDQPVITPTEHPLVFLYSAPPCAVGSRMQVRFRVAGGTVQNTPTRDCQDGKSMNFYIAGLKPQTEYSIRAAINDGNAVNQGPTLTVATDLAGSEFARQEITRSRDASGAVNEGVVLQAPLNGRQFATDLDGNLIWYYPGIISYITRPVSGGHFFGILQDQRGDSSRQILREFDLAGVTLRETNAARVSEQLVAMGLRPITGFHHEAGRLRDGKILVLAQTEQILTDVQGPGPINVVGDMIVVLDSNMQVVWAWDGFDHLDVKRLATFREQCPGGCSPLYLTPSANDWTHGNSVTEAPDGNLLFSLRHQDWVIKIDYQNGAGSGNVLWRLGKDGDFTILSDDPSPWFSHQHDAQIHDDGTLSLFDNSNVRHVEDPAANSRGQVFSLDEVNRIATLKLNADLGSYCFALGSAEKLRNGNYHFHCGWLMPDSTSVLLEVSPTGQTVYALRAQAAEYRSFRMRDLYTP